MKPSKRPARSPCASCPYRRDVPSGLWDASEYLKLPAYDGETWEQEPNLFMCHQRDGRVCAGWVGCHQHRGHARELLALRMLGTGVPIEAHSYVSPVPLFASGAEACAHGLRDIANPSRKARAMVARVTEKLKRSKP
jgi:hypothetical protein